jgi:hypothetical protein
MAFAIVSGENKKGLRKSKIGLFELKGRHNL